MAWIRDHVLAQRARIMSINETPHSVAFGSAVGMFFEFTPLFDVKTLLRFLFRARAATVDRTPREPGIDAR